MKHKQAGMTLTSFLVVLAVVGFALFIGMKLFPMYQEYYSVRSALKSIAAEPGSGSLEPGKVQELFFKRMDMNYADDVKPGALKVERTGDGLRMVVSYEVRREMIGNLDVVGKFNASQDLKRTGSE
ncbi:MAG: DUF4845 domain-containing protein [Stenotrophomonas sp.]|jgi:hypothetical protein|nr:MAG: DUF4845 domain-containing protein [Stenotrophomonas sp.]